MQTSTENIIWKQSIPVIFTVVFILINSVSETVFHSKVYSVWKKNHHFDKYGGHLKKMKKNYGQQSICQAYTIIMLVWNFHACITICTICPNFQTYISHYLQKIIFKFHHCTVNISYIACTIFDWLLIFCYLTWIWFGGWLKSTYFKVFLSWHSTMYLIWLRDSTAKGH